MACGLLLALAMKVDTRPGCARQKFIRMLAMRGVVIITVANFMGFAAGCTSTRSVSRGTFRAAIANRAADGVAVKTKNSRWRSRIDANSVFRFHHRQGGYWIEYEGRQLRVRADGIVGVSRQALDECIVAVRIAGASQRFVDVLQQHTEFHVAINRHGEQIELAGAPKYLGQLLVAAVGDLRRALERDRPELWLGAHLGTWQFKTEDGWQPALSNEPLLQSIAAGIERIRFYSWAEMNDIEVTDISGGKTIAALAATGLVGMAFAPAALFLRFGGPGGQSIGSSGSLDAALRGGSGKSHHAAFWSGDWLTKTDAPRVFSFSARRKAMVRLLVATDCGPMRNAAICQRD